MSFFIADYSCVVLTVVRAIKYALVSRAREAAVALCCLNTDPALWGFDFLPYHVRPNLCRRVGRWLANYKEHQSHCPTVELGVRRQKAGGVNVNTCVERKSCRALRPRLHSAAQVIAIAALPDIHTVAIGRKKYATHRR